MRVKSWGLRSACCLGLLLPALATAAPAPARGETPPPVSEWVQTGTTTFPPLVSIFRTQGIASDGESLWFSWLTGLSRTDATSEQVLASRYHDAIPPHLAATGHNHIGDIDVHDGILYAPIEDGPGYLSPWIALYRADDLAWTGRSYELDRAHLTEGVPWVAIDGPRRVAYTAEWNDTTRLNIHSLEDFRLLRTIELDREVPRIQGAKVFRGSLYIARDNGAEKSIEAIDPETGHVTHLFDRDLGEEYEAEGIAFMRQPTGTVMLTTDIYQGSPMSVQMRSYRIEGDVVPPALRKLQLRPARVRIGKRPAPIEVQAASSEPGAASVRWHRCVGRKGRCTRTEPRGAELAFPLRRGQNRFRVRAGVPRAAGGWRAMRPGRWILAVTPTDRADVVGATARARLVVVKPKRRRR